MRANSQTLSAAGLTAVPMPDLSELIEHARTAMRVARDPLRPRWATAAMEVGAMFLTLGALHLADIGAQVPGDRADATPPATTIVAPQRLLAPAPRLATPDATTLFGAPVVLAVYADAAPGIPAAGHFAAPVGLTMTAEAEPPAPEPAPHPVKKAAEALLAYPGPAAEKTASGLLAYAGPVAAKNAATAAIDTVLLDTGKAAKAAAADTATVAESTTATAATVVAEASPPVILDLRGKGGTSASSGTAGSGSGGNSSGASSASASASGTSSVRGVLASAVRSLGLAK